MIDLAAYEKFLRAKIVNPPGFGFEIDAGYIHPRLREAPFQHQGDIVLWALRGGRRAVFASFGLGKTSIQLELGRIILDRHDEGKGLIVCPLGVRSEFLELAKTLGIAIRFVRTTEEMDAPGLYLTNYESVREGKIDPRSLTFASLDEASVLRDLGTKTFREFYRGFIDVPYRYVATATPAPNEYIELLNYAMFLGVMDIGEAKTRFFRRNAEKSDNLTLHPHKEEEFWLWVNTWAVFLQRPSDLGYPDDAYRLPALTVRWHQVGANHEHAGHEKNGQGRLLQDSALGIREAALAKRSSLPQRITKVVEIAIEQSVFSRVLPEKQGEVSGQLARGVSEGPGEVQGAHAEMEREESGEVPSCYEGIRGEEPQEDSRAQRGMVCEQQGAGRDDGASDQAASLRDDAGAIRRNGEGPEGDLSGVPKNAADAGGRSLPRNGQGSGYPVPSVQRSAGIVRGGPHTAGSRGQISDQVVIWCDLNAEQDALESELAQKGISFASCRGSQDIEERETLLSQWKRRERWAFVSKPVMYGAGVNLQQAHTAIFVGVGFKFADFIQAIHRCHRFGQRKPVTVHIVYSAAEIEIVKVLQRKWAEHNAMMMRMSALVRQYRLNSIDPEQVLQRSLGVDRQEARGAAWTLVNNDAILETAAMAENSVGLIVTSIPFSTQYEYTPSYNDFGHTDTKEHFFAQMDFLAPSLLRVLEPGRVLCVHVKDRVRPGGYDNRSFQSIDPFHADVIQHYQRHGFVYMGMRTIVTDVVRENYQTHRLGWSMQCEDGSRMGCGLPEYVLQFRKPPTDNTSGYADMPVEKTKEEYSRARWQIDAHALWKSNGNRLLEPNELVGQPWKDIFRLFRGNTLVTPYDHERVVAAVFALDQAGQLPPDFMLCQPGVDHPDVWCDIMRARTLNTMQGTAGREKHLCPLQFDVVDRLITLYSNAGDVVYDPFSGLGTVPLRAVELGRRGHGCELNPHYFGDSVRYCTAAENKAEQPPSLFDERTEAVA
jgi:DNA modification methylase